jgi:formate dehydrogenase major subunit
MDIDIPHLCYSTQSGYEADGNCRACMVEIKGERNLVASCIRKPAEGMEIDTNSARSKKARSMVFELLMTDQPKNSSAHDLQSNLLKWASAINGNVSSRFPTTPKPDVDNSHQAITVNLDSCINCNLCVQACREVQVNDVIGMAYRGSKSKIVFDLDSELGESTCVSCGECVQVCPTGALMESNLLNKSNIREHYPDRSVDTLCPFCGVGCQTNVKVKGDKIISIDGRDGPSNESRLCVKGRFGFDYISHPDRLLSPLIRIDSNTKSFDLKIDNSNIKDYFREASWEEALSLAAKNLKKISDQYGGKSIAGFGSAKCSNEEAYLFQKLIRQGFVSNNVDHCTRLCHASSVFALMESLNSAAVTAPFTDALKSDCIIVIGARPSENHPVASTYIKNAIKKGSKLILIDPRGQKQGLAKYAEHIIQFKPGQDLALLNAMIHTIIKEKLYDTNFVKNRTIGFDNLVEETKDFSPKNMEKICGIKASVIIDIARLYAKSDKSIIFWGMGISQHVHGTENARCLISLALISGHIGKDGTGLHPLRGQNNVQGASDAGLIPMVYPDYNSVQDELVRKMYQEFWGKDLSNESGLTAVEIINEIHASNIKAMFILGENPAMSDPDTVHTRKAIAALDFLVVQEIFLTETAWNADVIFPASTHAEKWGTYTNTNRQIQIGRQVVKPPANAKEDWYIITELARHIGLDWKYTHPKDIFKEMSEIMGSLDNITWERLVIEESVTYPCLSPDSDGEDILFGDKFPTKDGRALIVPTSIVPPAETPDQDYPMVLTTGRLLEHWHTGAMTRRASILNSIEPDPIICLNKYDMEKFNIYPGNKVTISTRRGKIIMNARQDPDVPEGVVFVPFCYTEAAANVLTSSRLDPAAKIPEFKFSAAKISLTE